MTKNEKDIFSSAYNISIDDQVYNDPDIKKYVQTSKKVVAFCLLNLLVIEIYTMIMAAVNKDMSIVGYLITAVAAECLATVVWYMKNSEAEKTARIQMEIEEIKLKHNKDNQLNEVDIKNMIAEYASKLGVNNSPSVDLNNDISEMQSHKEPSVEDMPKLNGKEEGNQ